VVDGGQRYIRTPAIHTTIFPNAIGRSAEGDAGAAVAAIEGPNFSTQRCTVS